MERSVSSISSLDMEDTLTLRALVSRLRLLAPSRQYPRLGNPLFRARLPTERVLIRESKGTLRRLRHRWREGVGVYETPGRLRRCGSERKTVPKTDLFDVWSLGQETSVV